MFGTAILQLYTTMFCTRWMKVSLTGRSWLSEIVVSEKLQFLQFNFFYVMQRLHENTILGRYIYHRLNCLICCHLYCRKWIQMQKVTKGEPLFLADSRIQQKQRACRQRGKLRQTGDTLVNRLWGKDFRDATIIYIHEGHQGNWTKEGSEMEMKPLRLTHKEIIIICKTQETNECQNKTGSN